MVKSGLNNKTTKTITTTVNRSSPTQSRSGRAARNRRRRIRRREYVSRELAAGVQAMNMGYQKVDNRTVALKSGALSPVDPRTRTAMTQLGNTIEGRRACLKILHPCMEGDRNVIKIPDGAVSTSVAMERRDEYKVSAATAAVTAVADWCCVVITLPLINARQVVMRWSSTISPTQAQLEHGLLALLDNVGNSTYAYPTFTSLNTVIGVAVEGSILLPSTLSPSIVNTGITTLSGLIKSIRRSCCGVTTQLDASSLYNQGRVVTGQWTLDVSLGTFATVGTVATDTTAVTDVVDVYRLTAPPLIDSTMVQSDEFIRQAEAKDGSYMPIRTCANEWALSSATEYRKVLVDTTASVEAVDDNDYRDLRLNGWCVGVSYYSGLDYRSDLRIKVIEDMELVPSASSIYGPFATPALPSDARAREMVQEFSRTQAHDYPASYNEFGLLLQELVSGISKAVAGLGLPIISPIANTVHNVASGPVGTLVGGLLDMLF